MFDSAIAGAPATAADAEVVSAIGQWAQAEAAAAARRLAAIGELVARRCPADDGDPDLVDPRSRWACDPWDGTAAEVAAALGISNRRASSQMYLAQSLRERLPRVNALFLAGRINARLVSTISWRTHCVVNEVVMAAIDSEIAAAAVRWGSLSDGRVETLIDAVVNTHDPQARQWFRQVARTMDVQFGKPDDDAGTRSVWGRLFAVHAELIERRLTTIARAVCDADPRTVGQRRAEAMGAVFAGADRIACQCGLADCPNPGTAALEGSVVIHVMADQRLVEDAQAADPQSAERAGSEGADAAVPAGAEGAVPAGAEDAVPAGAEGAVPPGAVRRLPMALMANGGVVPNPLLQQLIHDGAQVVPLVKPCDEAEPRYRPSVKLQRFIRCRDVTCRFPGCEAPAEVCDIDHGIRFPLGPTHPSNLRCLCRKHHLLRTFWIGDDGWRDE